MEMSGIAWYYCLLNNGSASPDHALSHNSIIPQGGKQVGAISDFFSLLPKIKSHNPLGWTKIEKVET